MCSNSVRAASLGLKFRRIFWLVIVFAEAYLG
jgi:hypothetical protein